MFSNVAIHSFIHYSVLFTSSHKTIHFTTEIFMYSGLSWSMVLLNLFSIVERSSLVVIEQLSRFSSSWRLPHFKWCSLVAVSICRHSLLEVDRYLELPLGCGNRWWCLWSFSVAVVDWMLMLLSHRYAGCYCRRDAAVNSMIHRAAAAHLLVFCAGYEAFLSPGCTFA